MPKNNPGWRRKQMKCKNAGDELRAAYDDRDLAKHDAGPGEKIIKCSACNDRFHIVKK